MGESIESIYEASEADRGIQWRGGLDNAQGFWYNGRMIRSNSGVETEAGRVYLRALQRPAIVLDYGKPRSNSEN